jgi:hypothetical protein
LSENTRFDINTVIEGARRIVIDPGGYFDNMPRSGGYAEPLVFVTVMGLLAGVLGAVLSSFTMSAMGDMRMGLGSIIVMPIAAIIGSFVFAFIMWVIWKLMGSREDFETAYRIVTATMVILPVSAIVGLVPYFGTVVINAWLIWMMVLGSVLVHRLNKQKSIIVICVLGAIIMLVNLSGEHTQRVMMERYSHLSKQMKDLENLTPEEVGEITGEFLKGLEKGTQEN